MTQNDIQFNNVKTSGIRLGVWPILLKGQSGPDSDGGIINAIDIDWNGAEVEEDVTLNTTGDLLYWIKNKSASAGEAGPQGNQGAVGAQGAMGMQGAVGPQGNQGAVGAQGAMGMQGVAGSNGENGQQGMQGAVGAQGAQGAVGAQGAMGMQGVQGATGTFDPSALNDYATKQYVSESILNVVGAAPEALDTLKEIADKLGDNDDVVSALTLTVSNKANSEDVYTKDEIDSIISEVETIQGPQGIQGSIGIQGVQGAQGAMGMQGTMGVQGTAGTNGTQGAQGVQGATGTFDSSDLEDYATKETVYTKDEINGIQGNIYEAIADIQLRQGPQGIQGSIGMQGVQGATGSFDSSDLEDYASKEYVDTSIQSVDESINRIKTKYEALLSLLNIRDSQVNSVIVNQALNESTNVTYDEPVNEVNIPVTSSAYTVAVPLENDSTVSLSSNKYMTLFNTSVVPTSTTIQRCIDSGVSESGTSGTTVYLVGEYDTLTLENISPNVKSGEEPAKVNNVVITEDNTKNITLTVDLQDGATITNNSSTDVTISDKNNEATVLTVVAPNSTVTLNGGVFNTLNASVSDNTLIIKKTAHIGTLNVTKGNVKVEVPRQSDIANVISNITIANGYNVDYLHDEISSSNISKLTTTGTHVLTENITKTGNFSVGTFSSDDIVWNLNGHNITSSNTRGYGIFSLRGSAHLEINDSVGGGTITNTSNEYGFWTTTANSKLVINGGIYYAATHVLYAENGTIEVNGGEFHLTDESTAEKDINGNFKFLLNCHDAEYVAGTAKIIVRGGIFYGFNPAETYGEPNGPVSYVAPGYESVQTGTSGDLKIYTVRPIQV